jgi:poly(A) polymerase
MFSPFGFCLLFLPSGKWPFSLLLRKGGISWNRKQSDGAMLRILGQSSQVMGGSWIDWIVLSQFHLRSPCGSGFSRVTVLSASWLALPALQHLFTLFAQEGATLRLVGGSVRDGLLGLPVNDIDLAVDRDPYWVLDCLRRNHVKAIPTGIDHGTITAVINKRPYQITTLRVDVKTFGRHAEVAFTDDWVQDAQRRDFTMNAIYADQHGHLFDPVGGLEDLHHNRVQFIGEPRQRIQEDYLRILRFFRFSARFGREPYDEAGMRACKTFASHLPHLARERVTEEFLKLLQLPSPLYALNAMEECGVLSYILHLESWNVFRTLLALEKDVSSIPVRLAAFRPHLEDVKTRLRLSKHQEQELVFFMESHDRVTPEDFKRQAYTWGKERTLDLALLQMAERIAHQDISLEKGSAFLNDLRQQFRVWDVPPFPLSGKDALALGVKPGKQIGLLLKQVERWWLSQDLNPDFDACLVYLKSLL